MDQLERLNAFFARFGHRMGLWLLLTAAGALGVCIAAPHMVGVLAFKVVLITFAGYLGYWIARALERGPRPHELRHQASGEADAQLAAELLMRAELVLFRRALIVAAAMIASALGA